MPNRHIVYQSQSSRSKPVNITPGLRGPPPVGDVAPEHEAGAGVEPVRDRRRRAAPALPALGHRQGRLPPHHLQRGRRRREHRRVRRRDQSTLFSTYTDYRNDTEETSSLETGFSLFWHFGMPLFWQMLNILQKLAEIKLFW